MISSSNVKHPDDSQEAIDHMTRRAHQLVTGGMEYEHAVEESIDWWEKSLVRAQMIARFNAELRGRGKPTLHVPLFEAARRR